MNSIATQHVTVSLVLHIIFIALIINRATFCYAQLDIIAQMPGMKSCDNLPQIEDPHVDLTSCTPKRNGEKCDASQCIGICKKIYLHNRRPGLAES
jgi:hypothetical protein